MTSWKHETFFVLTSDQFDEIIKAVYGVNYEFIPTEEAHNYSSYSFKGITKGTKKGINIDFFKAHPNLVGARALLYDMCFKELIPEGDYLIEVYW